MNKAEAVELITKRRAEGKSLREIGVELGVTGEYVRQIAAMFGIPKISLPPKMRMKRLVMGRPRIAKYEHIRKPIRAAGLKDPYYAFIQHRLGAGRRGIPFRLTFEQWWEYWEPHYSERGNRAGQKVMCRTRDLGGYEVGNVRIDTVESNCFERALEGKCRKPQLSKFSNRGKYIERNIVPEGISWSSRPLRPDEILEAAQESETDVNT